MKIQLRVRTEYSFGGAFGQLTRVTERLKELGTTHAGMVEFGGSTWGHVAWSKACEKAGLVPAYGAEFAVVREGDFRPICWALAEDTSALYRLTTLAHKTKVMGVSTLTEEQIAARGPGLVMFAGAALSDPALFDYVDLNPGSGRRQRAALELAARTGKPIVLTSDNAYPAPSDRDAYLMINRGYNSSKPTAQHLLATQELAEAFPALTTEQITSGLRGAAEVAERISNSKLRSAPLIQVDGDLEAQCRAGIRFRFGDKWDEVYEARLQRELKLIQEKGFESYFFVVADLVQWAKEHMLVGPARGSAAGSLVCYLLRITEVDPIPYGLIFERFVDVTRKDLPDIDIDFSDVHRDKVYEYLTIKYGADKVARIGTISTFKPKSALMEVAKRLGIPHYETFPVKNAMFVRSSGDSRANNCLIDTLKETTPGQKFLTNYPAVEIAGELEGHASHTGVHAAGVCICNEPIDNFCTVSDGIMQLDKYDAEAINMLKVDALGLRTLGVIEDAGVVSRAELYNLKFDDPAVYELFNARKYSGIFQWEGNALKSVTNQMTITRFADLEQITALARPGPLGGGAATRFIERHEGREGWQYPHPSMAEYLDETYGLVLYQEQVLRIGREIGNLTWDDVTLLRKAMSKSYGKEYFDKFGERFVEGATTVHGVAHDDAWAIWDQINSMGSWAFNKSHSVSYAVVSYWTAWLKAHYPLQYAAAVLRSAQDEQQAIDVLREIVREGTSYVPFDPDLSEMNWCVKDGKLIGGYMNLKGIGESKARKLIELRNAGNLTAEKRAELMTLPNPFSELFPLHRDYGSYYTHPEEHGIRAGWKLTEIAHMPEEGEVLLLGLVTEKDQRDENEVVRVARRNGKTVRGNSLFLDVSIVDDSSSTPITLRVDRFMYDPYGKLMLERLQEGKDVLLIRGKKIRGFPMVKMIKVKCLTNERLLDEERGTTSVGHDASELRAA